MTGLRRVIVSVADMDRALTFYGDVLGLTRDDGPRALARIALPDGVELLLHERPTTPGGVSLSFAVHDVDAVTAAAVAAGAAVLDAPADMPWGERQAVLTDLDGHVVCLVSPS